MGIRTTAAAALMLLAAASASAQSDGPTSTADGIFTLEQSDRGAEVYERICTECHEFEFFTEELLPAWIGATVGALYDVIVTTMPEDNPNGLPLEVYADVLAYIFDLNGIPAGSRELEPNLAALSKIRIAQP